MLFAGLPATHFMPIRSAEPSAASPGRSAGIAWANDAAGRGCSPIFGGISAFVARPRSVVAASSRRSARAGIAAVTSAPVR